MCFVLCVCVCMCVCVSAANISDPVRLEIVCDGPKHLSETVRWFVDSQEKTGLKVCRMKVIHIHTYIHTLKVCRMKVILNAPADKMYLECMPHS